MLSGMEPPLSYLKRKRGNEKMEKVKGTILNFDLKGIKSENTGIVKNMYSVNFLVETDKIEGHYGGVILNSYASSNALEKLKSCLGKTVTIGIDYKTVYGKNNTFKKVVSEIDNYSIRDF